jgi:hypothetical protein
LRGAAARGRWPFEIGTAVFSYIFIIIFVISCIVGIGSFLFSLVCLLLVPFNIRSDVNNTDMSANPLNIVFTSDRLTAVGMRFLGMLKNGLVVFAGTFLICLVSGLIVLSMH